MLSILIFLFPPLYGEGYDTIGSLLNGQFSHIMDKSLFLRSERYLFRGLDLLDLDLAYEGIRFQRHECRRGVRWYFRS